MSKSEVLGECEYKKVPITDDIPEKEDNPPKYGYGVRHIQLAIFLMCLTVNIIGRGHMGVTIVAMTSIAEVNTAVLNTTIPMRRRNDTNIAKKFVKITGNELEDIILRNISNGVEVGGIIKTKETKHVTFSWSKSVQEVVLNAFFMGYAVMMFPMGMVCQRYGGKLPLQISLLINGVVCIATPWLTVWGGWKAVCCCRILQGLSQAGTYPCTQALLAKWVPTHELATLSSCVYTGLTLGTVIACQMSGFLGASRWGWPSIFYAIGVICLVSFVVLTVFGAASPLEHKSISEDERKYIMGAANGNTKKLRTPWRAIATCKPLWGTMITCIGSSISFVFFFNQVPSYIHYILGVNVRNSGLLSSLPSVASFFTTLGFGWMSDYCTNHKIVSIKNSRRICNSIAQCGIAFCLILTSYTNNTAVAVTCLVVALATNMGVHTGWMVNYIDLAPNFSGTLTATGSSLANIFIVLTPIVVSNVVTDTTNLIQWRIMFFIIAGLALICNAVFLILLSTDVQPWNYADETETCVEDAKEDVKKEKEKS